MRLSLESVIESHRGHYTSVSTYVTEVLRQAILTGALSQGDPLRQENIARQLSVSRVPVREALRLLEAEGLVSFRAHHGFTVARFNSEELVELSEIRFALEQLALQSAIENHTAETLTVVGKTLKALNKAEKGKSSDRRQELHRKFHLLLYKPCGKKRLLSLIESNFGLYESFSRIGSSQFPFVVHRDIDEHTLLVESVAQKQRERASEILWQHIVGQARAVADEIKTLSSSPLDRTLRS